MKLVKKLINQQRQVIIKWNMQHNVVVIPKSVTSSRIEENIDVFDFELSAEQMKRIDDLNKDQRIGLIQIHLKVNKFN